MTTLDQVCAFYHRTPPFPPSPVELKGVGRATLPLLFASCGFTRGAEIGVFEGAFSEDLCRANPALHLVGVDAWQPWKGYIDHTKPQTLAAAESKARERLAPYTCTLIKAFSTDAAPGIPDASLDFVYIDACHSYEHVCMDLFAWVPKVRPGGIVSGHDYAQFRDRLQIRVVEAIDGYTKAKRIHPWFLLSRRKTVPGEFKEHARSWFWVAT